jgi:anti-sigma factor RsiW
MTAAEHHHHGAAQGDCRRYLSSLSDYVDGVLSEELCRELEAHVASCENCRIVVNTLSKTVSLYRRLPSPDMPSEVKERLYKVLDISSFYSPGHSQSPKPDELAAE